jgi:hypothetical protein
MRVHREAQRQRESLEAAMGVVSLALFFNGVELNRIGRLLRDGALRASDSLFTAGTGFKTDDLQVLIQSALVAHLRSDLVWSIHQSYYLRNHTLEELGRHAVQAGGSERA